MKHLLPFLIFAFLFNGCSDKQKPLKTVSKQTSEIQKDIPILEEEYIDSLKIGIKGKNKIELKNLDLLTVFMLKLNFLKRRIQNGF